VADGWLSECGPLVLQADFSTVELGFNRSCVRPRDVACLTPRPVCCSEGQAHIGSERYDARAPGLGVLALNFEVRVAYSVGRSPYPGLSAMPFPVRRSGSRHSVLLLFCRHRPDHSSHLVGQRQRRHHSGLARDQIGQPEIGAANLAHNPSDHAHGADNQQLADVALPHLADGPEPGLAAGGSLSWHCLTSALKGANRVIC